TIAQSTKWINSPYRDVELEVLRICNEERANAGLAPLEWYEDTYYFANIRAKEIYKSFGHLRPDSRYWHTVYTDANVILHGAYGENIMRFKGYDVNYDTAREAVKTWMASSEHKANILNPKYTKLAVSFEWGEDNTTLCCVQSFFE
ncbi:MAG: CAP domain-containing protein, partial [Clostridia bacterium]|nr:CAP domain-containing protein [Clostridia bacterium]